MHGNVPENKKHRRSRVVYAKMSDDKWNNVYVRLPEYSMLVEDSQVSLHLLRGKPEDRAAISFVCAFPFHQRSRNICASFLTSGDRCG